MSRNSRQKAKNKRKIFHSRNGRKGIVSIVKTSGEFHKSFVSPGRFGGGKRSDSEENKEETQTAE